MRPAGFRWIITGFRAPVSGFFPVRHATTIMLPPDQLLLHPNEPVNLQIYRVLRRSIVNCTFLPGEPISDKDISEAFGVSRQPVRDAFIKLAAAGLIQVLPQRGTFVMKISLKRVENGRFIREAIEVAVVGRVAGAITPAQVQTLADVICRQELAAAQGDASGFLGLDDEFHSSLARMIDCADAWDLIEDIKAHMDRVRYLSLGDVTPLPALIAQHKAILEGLRSRDPAKAGEAMHRHLTEINASFGPIKSRNPAWFVAD
jgi:DNA-binding GntR family transcriptional regulator